MPKNTKKRIIQPVTFAEEEKDLLEYAKNQGKPYSVFIKDLIREKMGKPIKEQLAREDVLKMIEEYIKTHNITTAADIVAVEPVKQEDQEGLGKKSRLAYKNFIKR